MILVDTSVWIDYFNDHDTVETARLDQVLGVDDVAIGDLILLEILQGFRSDQDYKTAKQYLSALRQVQMLSAELAVRGADYYRLLRKQGITIRKTPDVIIATFCIENEVPLLFSDKDFRPFVDHLGLKSALVL